MVEPYLKTGCLDQELQCNSISLSCKAHRRQPHWQSVLILEQSFFQRFTDWVLNSYWMNFAQLLESDTMNWNPSSASYQIYIFWKIT